MAEEQENSECGLEEGVELELEVTFNEFDDEPVQDDGIVTEDGNGCSNIDALSESSRPKRHVARTVNTSDTFGEDAVKLQSIEDLQQCHEHSAEDGETVSSDIEDSMEIRSLHTNESTSKREHLGELGVSHSVQRQDLKTTEGTESTLTLTSGSQRKRRGSFSMEVDDESESEESKDKGGNFGQAVSDDKRDPQAGETGGTEVVKKKTRGGRKKRRRTHPPKPEHQRQYQDPESELYKLFEPLTVTAEDRVEAVAYELSDRLQERKVKLIRKVVQCLGCKKSLEILEETKKVQIRGGMKTLDGSRRRTSGGIFLTLLKSDRFSTKKQIKAIFAEENERLKNARKAKQGEEKEMNVKKIQDLRAKLQNERYTAKDVEMNPNQ